MHVLEHMCVYPTDECSTHVIMNHSHLWIQSQLEKFFLVTGRGIHRCPRWIPPPPPPPPPPMTHTQRPVTRSCDVFLELRPNKRLSKQWWGWWFEAPSVGIIKIQTVHMRLLAFLIFITFITSIRISMIPYVSSWHNFFCHADCQQVILMIDWTWS